MVYSSLLKKEKKLGVIGLGYVGLPLAYEFSKKLDVVGFDLDESKINSYLSGVDITNEVGSKELKESKIFFTSDSLNLQDVIFFVVAVPTPVGKNNIPNLNPLINASKTIGRYLKNGDVVVFQHFSFCF